MQFKPEVVNLFKEDGQFQTNTVSVAMLVDLVTRIRCQNCTLQHKYCQMYSAEING